MGLFDFLRKKVSIEPVIEAISTEELDEFIDKKVKQTRKNQQEVIGLIKSRMILLSSELKTEIKMLKNVDLAEKKTVERAKTIVLENLYNYAHYLEGLADTLEKLDIKSLSGLKKRIDDIFMNFEKRSSLSYQKATFLVGKELELVEKSITSFFTDFKKTIKENEVLISESKIIEEINQVHDRISFDKETLIKIEENIESISEQIAKFNTRKENLKEKIKQIKQSKEYLDQENEKENLQKNKQALQSFYLKLKNLINFKLLAKAYHSSSNKMALVKEYNENFAITYEKYEPEKLFDLLDLREIDLSAIKQQAQKIKDLKEKIANTPLQEDETKKLEKEINSIDGNLMDLKIQISKSERRMDNIESELKNKKSSLKVLLEKINVKIKETQDL